jgi:hypothetical protein
VKGTEIQRASGWNDSRVVSLVQVQLLDELLNRNVPSLPQRPDKSVCDASRNHFESPLRAI